MSPPPFFFNKKIEKKGGGFGAVYGFPNFHVFGNVFFLGGAGRGSTKKKNSLPLDPVQVDTFCE